MGGIASARVESAAALGRPLGSEGSSPEALSAEGTVRSWLRVLEAGLRERALVALGDFAALGFTCEDRSLFLALTGLCQPSSGSWNGLILEIRRAWYRHQQEGDPSLLGLLDGAQRLRAILEAFGTQAPGAVVKAAGPLVDLCHHALGSQPTRRQIIELVIALRNRISHGHHPHNPSWWTEVAAALEPLFAYLADQPDPLMGEDPPAPWIYFHEERRWSYGGLTRQQEAIFFAPDGMRSVSAPRGAEVLRALEQLTGREAGRTKAFRRLLGQLAPEAAKGVLLGDFLVGGVLGEGAFARVHRGVQLSTGLPVAVKLLADGVPAEVRERFQREARYLSRCAHPQVVRVLGYGEAHWLPPREISLAGEPWYDTLLREAPVKAYIAMELVEGQTLETIIRSGQREPASRPEAGIRLRWFREAAEALAAVHAQGLLHRDVKPTNLMVAEDGGIKVLDFGVARPQSSQATQLTRGGARIGTPAYMAPERLAVDQDEDSLGASVDVYGLSATFYELYTSTRLFDHGTQPMEAVTARKLRGDLPTPPRQIDRTINPDVELLLLGGLSPAPRDRPRSMRELTEDLRRVEERLPIHYRRPTLGRRLALGYQRHRRLVRLIAVFLLFAVAGLGLYIRNIRLAHQTSENERARAEHLLHRAEREQKRAEREQKRAEREQKRAERERQRAEGHAQTLTRQLRLLAEEREAKQAASKAATRARADAAEKRVLLDASKVDLHRALRLAERRAAEALFAGRQAEERARREREAKLEAERLLRENRELLERNQRLLGEEKARSRAIMERLRLVAPPE